MLLSSGYARLFEKQRQFLPVVEQVRDRLPQSGVRFYQPFVELGLEPGVQFLHDRLAVLLVEGEAFLRGHALFPRHCIIAVDLAQTSPAQTGTARENSPSPSQNSAGRAHYSWLPASRLIFGTLRERASHI